MSRQPTGGGNLQGDWNCEFRAASGIKFMTTIDNIETTTNVVYGNTGDFSQSSPVQVCCITNRTGTALNIYIAINGTYVAETSATMADGTTTTKKSIILGKYAFDQSGSITGGLYNVFLANYTMTTDDLNLTWNKGQRINLTPTVTSSPPPLSSPPSLTNGQVNNTAPRINTDVKFNITANDTNNITTYIFSWDNGTGIFRNFSLQKVPSGISFANVSFNQTILVSSGTLINWLFYANNTGGTIGQSSIFTLTVAGNIPPNLTLNSNNFFSQNNNTFINKNASQNVLLNFTLNDDIDVFGFEFNITNETSQIIINFTNTTMNGTFANFSRFINVSGAQGYYNASITVWDTHTAEAISIFKINDGLGNSITVDDNIKITAENAIYSTAIKKFDRYTFKFTYLPLLAPKNKVYYVESNNELFYRAESGYKAHFADWQNKKWIDFEGLKNNPLITKINDNKWKIEFNNDDSVVLFQSIGGLNSRTYIFQYYISDPTVKWFIPSTNPITFSTNQNLTFSLNVTGNFQNQTSFYLWNSSLDLVSITNVTVSINNTYFYNNTFSNLIDDLYYINATHFTQAKNSKDSPTITIAKIQLNNCTPAGINAVNYTFKDEKNQSIVTATVTGTYNYNISSTYTISYTTSNFTVCIYPNGTSIPTSYTLLYSGTGYPQRQYYNPNAIFNNQTVPINLWLLKSSIGIYARFKIADSVGNPLNSVKGIMSTALGDIEIETSDASGLMTFFENPDVTYTFTFSLAEYVTQSIVLRVTTGDIYTVTLQTVVSSQQQSIGIGINYFFQPSNAVLNNNTNYNFIFNLTSNFWNISGCTLYLQNTTTIFNQSSLSFNGSSCIITINFNTGNQTIITSYVNVLYNNTINQTYYSQYSIKYFYQGQYSLKTALDDIKNFTDAGFDNFGRWLIALIVIIVTVSYFAMQDLVVLQNPLLYTWIIWAEVTIFSYMDFMNIPLTTIPNDYLRQWIFWLLITMVEISYTIDNLLLKRD